MVAEVLHGRLVLADSVVAGRLVVDDGWIVAVEPDAGDATAAGGPLYAPGLIDVHVHGWGGHDATGDSTALAGMARARRTDKALRFDLYGDENIIAAELARHRPLMDVVTVHHTTDAIEASEKPSQAIRR